MTFGFPERLFPRGKYDTHRMRVFALAISWISIVYNGIEGGVSIGLGADVASRALIVFGVQSAVEVLSAVFVIYRFRRELNRDAAPNVVLEKRATLGIGVLFILLTIGTWAASIVALVKHAEPDSSKPSLIISATALACMILVWLPKPWLAAELNSSVMRGEAACSLACIYLTIVLLVGSLIYKLWHAGWWIDSAVAILLGFFFLHQGWEMISWARNKDFNGGCCKTCSAPSVTVSPTNNAITSDNCNKDCSQTCCAPSATVSSTNNAVTSDKCNKGCSQKCSAPSATVSPTNNAITSDKCKKDCSQTCCAPSATVSSTNNAVTSDKCNKGCSQTCCPPSATVPPTNNAATSDNCNKDCSQTCSAPSATVSPTINAVTSAIEYGNVEKCSCCASRSECIEAGTCLCRPLLGNKTLNDSICCSGPTKCCLYGMTAVFVL